MIWFALLVSMTLATPINYLLPASSIADLVERTPNSVVEGHLVVERTNTPGYDFFISYGAAATCPVSAINSIDKICLAAGLSSSGKQCADVLADTGGSSIGDKCVFTSAPVGNVASEELSLE
ncbi:uncharacterized protein L969DRAFT_95455 [Mixia osmundae IAM 14324]|uniref:Uncharacterized protein n=1 Tax=Mixia osmundae (strain CBS 9802 / IAM 14324 / JCM 22182 / KY 12970) TaxID=764103 RepID=G7E7G3_MIXOS|nr:uncharacterized protein L969DRAFT_95455 [Mixia osmundae IAM 14324]KEI38376.1 hypothetical protein L969DRAFT_95455 [Mixia osmundae IAM 14324]GAA98773.1 hypothetical protein E5Q_05461 [Mixia osmundae IAM 14324]